MKLSYSFSLILICVTLAVSACKEPIIIGGDVCNYKNFNDTVTVFKLFIHEDYSIGEATFQSLDGSNYSYSLHTTELASVEKNFTIASLNSKKGIFLIEGEKITEGTCMPYSVRKITLLK